MDRRSSLFAMATALAGAVAVTGGSAGAAGAGIPALRQCPDPDAAGHPLADPEFTPHRDGVTVTPRPASCALLVIDMVNDFLDPAGALIVRGAPAIVEPVDRLVVASRDLGMPVIWACDRHLPDDREFLRYPPHCLRGTWGAEVIDRLSVEPGDHVVSKRHYSAFFDTGLDDLLRSLGVEQVIACGVVTNTCVRSTVHDAYFLEYDVFVPVECVWATSAREQESTLADLSASFADVVRLDLLLEAANANA